MESALETRDARREGVLATYKRHLGRGRARLGQMMGAYIETTSFGSVVVADGVSFLDCSGYGVFLLGHCHPRVVDAVVSQTRRNPLGTRVLLEPVLARAAETLTAVTPPGLEYAHFVCSGAEAVETGIKLGRLNGARRLVATHGAFHGKTMGALTATGQDKYRTPFEPLLPDVAHVPFGDAEALVDELASGPPACVLLEPIQAEGGVNIPVRGYLTEVAGACRETGSILVLDEIQTGLGRVGTWWAAERDDVVPDILLVGKGLSGGVVPVAAAVCSAEVYEPLGRDPLLHSSTFGGAPVAAAAAQAAIETIQEDRLVHSARRLGQQLLSEARAIFSSECPHLLQEARGAGLLIGFEFTSELAAGEFVLQMLERRVLVNHSLNASRVIRLTPPAVLTDADIDWLIQGLAGSARALAEAIPPETGDD